MVSCPITKTGFHGYHGAFFGAGGGANGCPSIFSGAGGQRLMVVDTQNRDRSGSRTGKSRITIRPRRGETQ